MLLLRPRGEVLIDTDSEPKETDNNTTTSRESARPIPSCSCRYASMLERMRSPPAQGFGTESHVFTAHVAAMQPHYNPLQLPNRENKASVTSRRNVCMLLLISHLSVTYCSLTGNATLSVFKVMETALPLIQWHLSM